MVSQDAGPYHARACEQDGHHATEGQSLRQHVRREGEHNDQCSLVLQMSSLCVRKGCAWRVRGRVRQVHDIYGVEVSWSAIKGPLSATHHNPDVLQKESAARIRCTWSRHKPTRPLRVRRGGAQATSAPWCGSNMSDSLPANSNDAADNQAADEGAVATQDARSGCHQGIFALVSTVGTRVQ